MGIFRSEEVDLYQILIPKDNDWEIINELGHLNCVSFINLNIHEQPHHLRYIYQLRRVEETLRKISSLEEFCQRFHVKLEGPQNVDEFLSQMNSLRKQKGKAISQLFQDIEQDVEDKSSFLFEQTERIDDMIQTYNTMIAKISVFQSAARYFNIEMEQASKSDLPLSRSVSQEPLLLQENRLRFCFLGGIILREEQLRFKKFLFRATRGKALIKFFNMDIPQEDRLKGSQLQKEKIVYLCMFEEGSFLKDRITRICQSFLEPLFEIKLNTIQNELNVAIQSKDDAKNLIRQTKFQLRSYLQTLNKLEDSDYSLLIIYKWFILKEKAIYTQLNMLKTGEKLMMGLMWCPEKLKQKLWDKIDEIRQARNIDGPQVYLIKTTHEGYQGFQKPTFFEMNEVTMPFQEIVNTYGVPIFQEANPALFTIITFPFLFGVMFGDIMHGFILFLFGLYLCYTDRKPGTAIWALGQVRYLFMLMGLFSTYCGFIYNDMTSIPLILFGESCYVPNLEGNMIQKQDCVYPFGLDPAWTISKNELNYVNSLKMKIAVILGVGQMALGICMKGLNNLHQYKHIDFLFEFLPQLIMLLGLFGFMDLLIILKWNTDYENMIDANPPSVISMMIDMCLNFGVPQTPYTQLFYYQTQMMQFLLVVSILCAPIMLLVKPIYEINKMNKSKKVIIQDEQQEIKQQYKQEFLQKGLHEQESDHIDGSGFRRLEESEIYQKVDEKQNDSHKQHSTSDIFIHQLIETIEFVLGTVSNTASYLRLWALSLAHSQLAKVFFDNTIKVGLQSGSFLILFFGFFAFITFTIGVLMLMDLMEAFLHTLRLHWVEFQNKFYKGTGIKFVPFSIDSILASEQSKTNSEKQ